ncbi:Hpt domain-containing protein [Fibrisoma limi]|nr:Hpt domain-containing protein [Fibrisoma limi]
MFTTPTPITHTIDHERLNRLHGGDQRQIVNVLTIFIDEVMPDFDDLEGSIQQEMWPDVADKAHKILPWMGMAGLTSLESELRSLEQLAKTNPAPDVLINHWKQFRQALGETLPLVIQERNRLA